MVISAHINLLRLLAHQGNLLLQLGLHKAIVHIVCAIVANYLQLIEEALVSRHHSLIAHAARHPREAPARLHLRGDESVHLRRLVHVLPEVALELA